jgi:Retrotransposon gag protein/Zinc knuckle
VEAQEQRQRDLDLDARLIAAYERGRQAADQNRPGFVVNQGAVEDSFRRLYDTFIRLGPSKFDGSGGYMAAEEWLAGIKAKLVLCRAPEEDRTELAEHQLENDARFWWDGAKRNFQEDVQRIPWNWFEEQFNRRFLGTIHREELRRQFIGLRQSDRSVAEYNNKFLSLSRYALDIRDDVHRYRRQYVEGLDPEIVVVVDSPAVVGIQALMEYVEQVEVHHKRRAEQRAARNVRLKTNKFKPIHPNQLGHVVPPQKSILGTPMTSGTGSSFDSTGGPWCRRCNKSHLESECRYIKGTCFNCGNSDHWARDCPHQRQKVSGPSSSGPVTGHGRGGVLPIRGRGVIPQNRGG